jgi:hypothetical protein
VRSRGFTALNIVENSLLNDFGSAESQTAQFVAMDKADVQCSF